MKMEFTFGTAQPANPPTAETPFRILVLGDLDGRTSRNLKQPLAGRRPVPVDVDNFELHLKKLHAEVQLSQPGVGPTPARISVSGPDDLHPDRLFERMDIFTNLRRLRAQLLNPAMFVSAAAEVRAWSGTATPIATTAVNSPTSLPARESDAGTLERLLGHAPSPATTANISAAELIRRVVAPHIVAAPAADQPALVAAVDAAASELMRAVLHDPAFQALEATWRGIDFLIRRLETSETLQVCLLNVSRAELASDVMANEDLLQSELFRILVEATVQSPGAEPWALLLGLYHFESSPEDIALLGRMAKLAQAAGAPFVAAAGDELMQAAIQNPETLATNKEWMALRTCPEADALGLTGPRFLLRLPYGKSTDPLAAFAFEELPGQPTAKNYLWGNPSLALGCLMGQTFAGSSWEMSPGDALELAGLPVHSWKEGTESRMTPCAETWLNNAAAERLLQNGLMPFQSIQGRDTIRLARDQSIRQPLTTLASRWA